MRIIRTGYVAHRRRAVWTVRRRGQSFTARKKLAAWRVSGSTFSRRDLGAPGRGRKVIPVRAGMLRRFGYSAKLSAEQRRAALRRADRRYGSASVWKKLQAMVIFRAPVVKGTKRVRTAAQLRNYRIFKSDRDWVKRKLLSKKERAAMTRPARRKWMRMTPKARAKAMPGGRKRKARKIREDVYALEPRKPAKKGAIAKEVGKAGLGGIVGAGVVKGLLVALALV